MYVIVQIDNFSDMGFPNHVRISYQDKQVGPLVVISYRTDGGPAPFLHFPSLPFLGLCRNLDLAIKKLGRPSNSAEHGISSSSCSSSNNTGET